MCNNSTSVVFLKSHKNKDNRLMIYKPMNIFTCVENGSALFNNRGDMIVGYNIICEIMQKWGLRVHTRDNGKNIKLK